MSWGGNRPRNRLHRHDLRGLDSRLRTRVRSQRQVKLVGILAAGAVAAGLAGWGIWYGARESIRAMFFENPAYQIREITVQNSGDILKPERVLADLRVQRGQNLLSVDLMELRRELELRPVVERAEVCRELPGQLVIRITERVPVANITAGANGPRYQIDRRGVVMDLFAYQRNSEEISRRLATLPNIVGANIQDLKMGRVTPSAETFHALNLIQKLDRLELGAALEIDSIDVSRRGMLLVNTAEGALVKMTATDMDKQLRRLAFILSDGRQKSLKVATVDLTVGRDVPVTFASTP